MLVQKENGEGQYIFAASLPRGELQGGGTRGEEGSLSLSRQLAEDHGTPAECTQMAILEQSCDSYVSPSCSC